MADEFKIYLGVDWGEKRIGLSLADSITKLATPFKTVGSAEESWVRIWDELRSTAITDASPEGRVHTGDSR